MGRRKRPAREAWLDSLKGFAILLVILGHVLSGYLDAWTFQGASYGSFYTVRTWIYYFHMPLFFLLSGFTFTLAYWRDGRLNRSGFFRQLLSLLWLYVLYAVIQWAVKQAVPELVNDPYDLEDLMRMAVEPLGNFWYLYVLIWLYGLGAVTRTPAWPARWLLLPAALALMAADLHWDWTALTRYRIVYHFFFFALGCAMCRRRSWLVSKNAAGVSAMVLATALFFYCFRHTRTWYASWHLAIGLSISYLLVQLFYRWAPLAENRFLLLCGRHCLELYLLHTFFTAGLRSLLPLLGVTSPWLSVWVNFAVSTGLCLGIARLADVWRPLDLLFRPARFVRSIQTRERRRAHGAPEDSAK